MNISKVVHSSSSNKTAVKKVTKKLVVIRKASIAEVTNKKVVEQEALALIQSGLAAVPKNGSVQAVEEIVSNYREHTRKKLAKEFSKIVDNMLAAAKTGKLSDTKMKLLLELAGVTEDPTDQSRTHGPSLGKLLLNEIKQRRKTALAVLNKSIAESESASVAAGSEQAGAGVVAIAASSALEDVPM